MTPFCTLASCDVATTFVRIGAVSSLTLDSPSIAKRELSPTLVACPKTMDCLPNARLGGATRLTGSFASRGVPLEAGATGGREATTGVVEATGADGSHPA